MLTDRDVRMLLERVTYRPGWDFHYTPGHPEGPTLNIYVNTPNARGEGFTVLHIESYISPNDRRSPSAFLSWLAWRLQRVEVHEAMEWFKVDGKPWQDPHNQGEVA